MIGCPPYVVVITAPSVGVGKSTLASNLAVYLKGLDEDLPVAFVSLDAAAEVEAMFALPGSVAGSLNDLRSGIPLPELLTLGEFGVEFCSAGSEPEGDEAPDWLRKGLVRADYDGILILDVANDHALWQAAIWAADLIMVPIKDPAALGALTDLRKELLAGGGNEEQLWLLPSELGRESRYQCRADLGDFLRFAAEQRSFQVLDETFVVDSLVREQAAELAKPVLTRAPQSILHRQLRKLADLILRQRQQQSSYACRVARWNIDGALPARARRVDLTCPLCRRGVLQSEVRYLESYPARKRLLLHDACVLELLAGTAAAAFLASAGLLLIRPAAAHGGAAEELRVEVLSSELELLSSELLTPAGSTVWAQLLYSATGRKMQELYREVLLVSLPLSAAEALSAEWYADFVVLRGRLRQLYCEEII